MTCVPARCDGSFTCAAARRVRRRHVAGDRHQDERRGLELDRLGARRSARHRLCADRVGDAGLLGRRSPWRKPLREFAGRARREHRQTSLAFSDLPPRSASTATCRRRPFCSTVTHNGRRVDAVAQGTKHGLLFVFNRVTGEPLWPIREQPVPPSRPAWRVHLADAAGSDEAAPLMRQTYTEADASTISPDGE